MISRLIVRRQAKADIRKAAQWYEGQRAGLGRAFVQQIDALLDRVRANPMQYQIIYREVRRAISRRFSALIGEARLLFDHPSAQAHFGASVFWLRRLACLGGEQMTIEYWQVTGGGAQRGILEIIPEAP